ncbi:MAG: thioesterase family protein [Verrucomicrobiota bacterium]
MNPAYRYCHQRIVEFSETDLAGIVHFSNFFRYMESAEHAFYRSLGFTVHDFRVGEDGTRLGWPRVHAEADYRLPLRFEETVDIELVIEEVRNRSVRYQFGFWKQDQDEDRVLAATGRMSVVCVAFQNGGMESISIPDGVRQLLCAAPPEEWIVPNGK